MMDDKLPPHARLPITMRRDPNDYPGVEWYDYQFTIICNGLRVGHIGKGAPNKDVDQWQWYIICELDKRHHDRGGRAATFEESTKLWKARWAQVTPDFDAQRRVEAKAAEDYERWNQKAGRTVS
jgi:hypothetical protein